MYRLIIFIVICHSCAALPEKAGGTVSGEIFLNTDVLTFNGKDILLQVATDDQFNNVVLTSVYPIDKPRFIFNLFGVKNGTYYLMAFEDKNDNGIWDLNAPTGDATLSENFGILDADYLSSDFSNPTTFTKIEVKDNSVENIQFYIDTAN